MLARPPRYGDKSGEVRLADSSKFKASVTIAAAHVLVQAGGLRVLQWHLNVEARLRIDRKPIESMLKRKRAIVRA